MNDAALPNQTAYAALASHYQRIASLSNALGILHWDAESMMPDGGAATRADSLATIEVLKHGMATDRRIGDWLEAAEEEGRSGALDEWAVANLREIRREWIKTNAVPTDLVEANSRAVSACEMAWRTARPNSDFASLLPLLETVLRRQREIAEAKGAVLGLDPYDALMNDYEPGARAARIDALFDDLAAFLPGFVDEAIALQARRPAPVPFQGPFPVPQQRELGLAMMKVAGFDFGRGRLDVSAHPFCGGADHDVRITTRYDEAAFLSALMGVMHETGHALYEQGRPAAQMAQPVGQARSLSVHESQSLLIEMQVCRSREFVRFAAPRMAGAFPSNPSPAEAWDPENVWRLMTRVQRGFIRVDSDEATYPAHVILRYRLERALIGGDLALADLPGAWADGMKALLGIVPPDDRRGCLQDIHWPGGAWGYFPTYTLGAMTAAQLYDAAKRQMPEIPEAVAQGDFGPLVAWLRREVHGRASLYETDELLTLATGRPLDASVFRRHLAQRYLEAA